MATRKKDEMPVKKSGAVGAKDKPVTVRAPVDTVRDEIKDRVSALIKAKADAIRAKETEKPKEVVPVSAGPVDKITDVLINPTGEKILELTDFDRNQVTLIPQLGIIDDVWEYLIECASYRSDHPKFVREYKKESPTMENPVKRFVFLLAQCRRSLGGKTQKALEDLALADLETRSQDGESFSGRDFEE